MIDTDDASQLALCDPETAFAPTACVNLGAIRHNLALVRHACPQSRVMAVVKADAYGHGLVAVARTLSNADGFAVARFSEAVALRRAGIAQRILILATILSHEQLAFCSTNAIDVVVHDHDSLASALTHGPGPPIRVWLKLDSGMHRAGFDPREFVLADQALRQCAGIGEIVHMTHFCDADAHPSVMFDRQLALFRVTQRHCPPSPASAANSAAIWRSPATHMQWVRPGISLYGGLASADQPDDIRAAMRLSTRVIAMKDIRPGDQVGYHGRWAAASPTRLALVGIGYGDGYPRHVRRGVVSIRGRTLPVVGRISMDSLSVDATSLADCAVGDEVELWGSQVRAANVAENADTIDYQLFTGLANRVHRSWIE